MRKYLPPLILFFLLLIGWQALALGINAAYILPTPIQVIQKLWELREPLFMVHLPATMSVTFIGLGISVVLGLALAIAMDMHEGIRRTLYPLVIASQTIRQQPLRRCLFSGSAIHLEQSSGNSTDDLFPDHHHGL